MDAKQIDVNFDIENYVFLDLREYLSKKSKFITDATKQVCSRPPKQLAVFPTIVFRETNNIDDTRYRSLDRSQLVNQITDTIEIYTQDMVLNGVRYASKTIMSELKYLVFDFFEQIGAVRISAGLAETSDYQVDRYVITERYYQNNWNKKIG